MRRAAALLLCLLAAARIAAAERDIGAAVWTVSGDDVALHYTFPKAQAAQLAAPGAPAPATAAIAHYVFSKVVVSRHGTACEALDQGYDLGRIDARYVGDDLLSFEIFFHCAGSPGAVLLRNDSFFDRSAEQVGLAKVWAGGAAPVLRLVTAGNSTIQVEPARPPPPSPLRGYVSLGFGHALASLVQLCLACGLSLLLRNRRELGWLVGALLAGCLAAAWAGSTGGWFLHAPASRAFAGFLVLLVGALFIARRAGRANIVALGLASAIAIVAATLALLGAVDSALCLVGAGAFGVAAILSCHEERFARWLPPLLGLLVGLVDGFSLVSLFAPLHAVVSIGAAPLMAHGVGALLGLVLIGAVAAAVRALLPRFAGFARASIHGDLATAALAAVGVFAMLAG